MRDPPREVFTFNQFHHQRGDISTLFEAVDLGDVRMIQRGREFCFPVERERRLGSLATESGKILLATSRLRNFLFAVSRCERPEQTGNAGTA